MGTQLNLPRFPISFPDGRVALGVRPTPGGDLARTLRGMGLTTGVPTIVLVGAGATGSQLRRLGPLLEKVVIPVALATGASVVDEGRTPGIGALVGEACRRRTADFPLVGVAPNDVVESTEDLDSNHTHFVAVPADEPGWAALWTSRVASALAGGHRSVALVIAGGEPAWESLAEHRRAGRLIMAVARTGGVADHLAASLKGQAADRRAGPLTASGRVFAADPAKGATRVAELLRRALTREEPGPPRALGPGRGET